MDARGASASLLVTEGRRLAATRRELRAAAEGTCPAPRAPRRTPPRALPAALRGLLCLSTLPVLARVLLLLSLFAKGSNRGK